MSPALKGQRTDLSVEVLRAGQAIFCFDFEVTLVDAPAGAIFYFQRFKGALTWQWQALRFFTTFPSIRFPSGHFVTYGCILIGDRTTRGTHREHLWWRLSKHHRPTYKHDDGKSTQVIVAHRHNSYTVSTKITIAGPTKSNAQWIWFWSVRLRHTLHCGPADPGSNPWLG